MRKIRWTIYVGAVVLGMSGCNGSITDTGKDASVSTEYSSESSTTEESSFPTEDATVIDEPNRDETILGEYTGYLDECEWYAYAEEYRNQDYDGDELSDRVYREYTGDNKCLYRIEFGNGTLLQWENADATKYISLGRDVREDGNVRYITYEEKSQMGGMSVGRTYVTGTACFCWNGEAYEKIDGPIAGDESGYGYTLSLRSVDKEAADGTKHILTLSCDELNLSEEYLIYREEWDRNYGAFEGEQMLQAHLSMCRFSLESDVVEWVFTLEGTDQISKEIQIVLYVELNDEKEYILHNALISKSKSNGSES